MTRYEVKKWLSQVGKIVRDEQRVMEEIETLRSRQTSVAKVLTGMPGGSGQAYTLDDYAADLDMLERKLLYKLQQERVVYTEIRAALDLLTGLTREIMVERYLMLKSWEQIAVCHDKSYRYMMKLQRRALDKLAEELEKI